ncbi:MAG: hypothetical protein NW214_00990 [Pseudanabaenaceae cyanobacterium bins.39]|nr:hypothetical protein [Pseudanabaenaceae cyanobacterium bins.39]
MNLITSSVDIEGITSSVPRSQFDENELEYLANLFLKSGDTVSPILLHEKSPIAFEVLKGHREYYAALKAQEIDARFESIRAYVVPSDRQDIILEQYDYFRNSKVVEHPSNSSTDQVISISDIKSCISKEVSPLIAQSEKIDALIKAIADLDKRIPPLPAPRPDSQLLYELNHQSEQELITKFTKAGWKGKPLKTIVDSIIETRPYDSFADLTSRKIKGSRTKFLTEATLVKVLDSY